MTKKTLILLMAVMMAGAMAFTAGSALAQKRGGIVNYFAYADPARLDIFTETPLVVQQVTAGIYSGLLQFSPDDPSKIVPDLATSYYAAKSKKTWYFNLRKGVKWHDGKPFTSADVIATFNRLLDPKMKTPRCGSIMKPIVKRVRAKGKYLVVFTLKFPAATLIPGLASAWCRVAAAHILKRDGNLIEAKSQIGTGPFKLKRYKRGVIVEWERNPDYYNPKLPYVDGVKTYIIKDKTRQLAAAKAGQLDLWDTWPPMSKSASLELKNAQGDNVKLYSHAINTIWAVHFNTTRPPFDKKDMRKAVMLGLDRKALMLKAFEGIGYPCGVLDPNLYGDFALPASEVAKLPGCRQPKARDVAAAKKLVAKHYPNGVDIEIVTRTVGNYVDRIQLVAAELAKLNIRAKIKTYDSAAGYAVYRKGDFTMLGTQDTALFLPDPSIPFSILYTETAARNWGRWIDAKINKMAPAGLKETNKAKRVKIYHEMQRYIITQDTQAVVIGWVEGWFFTSKRLKNYKPANTIYDNNTFMKVWLDE
ncbi:MAG: ABC transporter substrate-binding protein [bacterium]